MTRSPSCQGGEWGDTKELTLLPGESQNVSSPRPYTIINTHTHDSKFLLIKVEAEEAEAISTTTTATTAESAETQESPETETVATSQAEEEGASENVLQLETTNAEEEEGEGEEGEEAEEGEGGRGLSGADATISAYPLSYSLSYWPMLII